ncbi:MAG: hypothetical protein Q8Q85_16775 [Gemmatimonadales bacterium]|nr:hypothetical protein [Gemmatimonadales bacterium]
MLSLLLALATAAAPQQPTTLDVPVYRDSLYGVSLPRPFDDWVFEPASSRGTTTVIFHPRDASLREQLWGALVLTTFNRDVPIGQVADQRVLTSWQATLGPSFTLLTRDSMTVVGLPAIHVVMGGTIDHAVLDVEEYLVARGGDLILLQFRYPRGLPRDSIAAGYERVFDGIRIRGAPGERASPQTAADEARRPRTAMWSALRASPWRLQAYDALVRYDTTQPRLDLTARLDLANDDIVPRDSVAFWLAPFLVADSVRAGLGRSIPLGSGPVQRVALGARVAPQGQSTVTVYYHATPDRTGAARDVRITREEALVLPDWIPRVQSPTDSSGQYAQVPRARQTLRFDLPGERRAVAPGRLTSEVTALGRRRMTWLADDAAVGASGFAIANYRTESRDVGRLRLKVFLRDSGEAAPNPLNDSLVAQVARGWSFYSRAFGPLETSDISIVEGTLDGVRGAPGVLFVGAGVLPPANLIFREMARSWWGGAIAAAGPGSAWITDAFPAWASIAARGVIEGDTVRQRLVREAESAWHLAVAGHDDPPLAGLSVDGDSSLALLLAKGAAALEAARRAAGEARFREAIRTFAAEHRAGWARVAAFLPLLGPEATAVIQPYLFGPQPR